MTQPHPQNVIYLPRGVIPPAAAQPTPIAPTGIPFDRNFFENVLPAAIRSFCDQVKCTMPIVELLTVDGVRHYVNGISGTSDAWVALHTSHENHEEPTQTFVPYQTIFRVEIHPEPDSRRQRKLGFLGFGSPPPALPPGGDGAAPEARPTAKAKRQAK
jgi:hypothetical protein